MDQVVFSIGIIIVSVLTLCNLFVWNDIGKYKNRLPLSDQETRRLMKTLANEIMQEEFNNPKYGYDVTYLKRVVSDINTMQLKGKESE